MTSDTLVHFLLFAAGLFVGVFLNVADRLNQTRKAKPLPYQLPDEPAPRRRSVPPLVDLSAPAVYDSSNQQRAA